MLPRVVSWRSVTVGLFGAGLLALGALTVSPSGQASRGEFARAIERFSEQGGYFDTDNLISNERSYLHPLGALRDGGVEGGVYIGVGPDQNFSYVAQVRPSLAFLVDIRRDNLLLHLLFKALFALSSNRVEYLSHLFGRAPPDGGPGEPEDWHVASVESLVSYVDGRDVAVDETSRLLERVRRTIAGFGVSLTADDYRTIARFHGRFMAEGLGLRFHSTGRPPRPDYPSYRDLLLEVDRDGRRAHFLAREDAFQFLKQLQAEDRVIPVVGDLAGGHALQAIGAYMQETDQQLSVFYTSNVELYLFQDGRDGQWMANLATLPRTNRSVIVRSVFRTSVPGAVPGYSSASLVQSVDRLVGRYADRTLRSYWDVVTAENR